MLYLSGFNVYDIIWKKKKLSSSWLLHPLWEIQTERSRITHRLFSYLCLSREITRPSSFKLAMPLFSPLTQVLRLDSWRSKVAAAQSHTETKESKYNEYCSVYKTGFHKQNDEWHTGKHPKYVGKDSDNLYTRTTIVLLFSQKRTWPRIVYISYPEVVAGNTNVRQTESCNRWRHESYLMLEDNNGG